MTITNPLAAGYHPGAGQLEDKIPLITKAQETRARAAVMRHAQDDADALLLLAMCGLEKADLRTDSLLPCGHLVRAAYRNPDSFKGVKCRSCENERRRQR